MERKKASDFPQEVLNLFDGYVHGTMDRRAFLDRAAKYAIGGLTAAAMLESLKPNFAWAQQVAKDDARIKAGYLTYPSPQGSGTMRGYFAHPARPAGKLPGVLVIHENRGLNPYIEDVARRLAVDNFVAFAPDALTPVGGYPGDEDTARKMFAALDGAKRTEDLVEAAAVLKAHGVRYEMHMYEGVNHGFHNDTTPRYDEAAAKLAWQRTIAFFEKHLRS